MQNFAKHAGKFTPLLYILPALICYIWFLIIPIARTLQFSFVSWNGISPTMEFVGLANYRRLLSDPIFWSSLTHNILWIIFTIILPVLLGLVLAVLISSPGIKGALIFRSTYFLPFIISLVAVGIVWTWIYNPSFGIINEFLRAVGLDGLTRAWLGDENTVLPALIITGSWTYFGFCMIIFLAALQGLDKTYFEVAKLEGASPIQTFFRITVPLLKNTVTLLVLYSLIGSFKVFDLIYVMTKGGPYHSSEVISTYMYAQAFQLNEVGYGSAISMALALLTAVCSFIYIRASERE